MKKPLALFLSAVMTIGMMTGCGNQNATQNDKSDTATQPGNSTVAESPAEDAEVSTVEEALSGKIVVASNRTDIEDKLIAYAEKFMELNPGTTVEFETIKE